MFLVIFYIGQITDLKYRKEENEGRGEQKKLTRAGGRVVEGKRVGIGERGTCEEEVVAVEGRFLR